jgi:hypothetical protein
MTTFRMIPPPAGDTVTVNGRYYVGVAGTVYDVPDFDGKLLEANGWQKCGDIGDGTTAQRQAQSLLPMGQGRPLAGDEFYDQTLNMILVYDGAVWRRPDTGAAV